MKKFILLSCFAIGIISLQSCKKERETKYVTLNEDVKSGTTYSLDLNNYAKSAFVATITTQPSGFTVSQVDCDATTRRNIYHFSTDTKTATQEKTVIEVKEKNNGRCSHDDEKTVITINFSVSQ